MASIRGTSTSFLVRKHSIGGFDNKVKYTTKALITTYLRQFKLEQLSLVRNRYAGLSPDEAHLVLYITYID